MTLSTNFTEGTVVRKCEDFDWLRESIIKRYPGYFVPPLEVYREIYQEDKEGVRLKVFEVLRFINSLTRYDYFRYSFLIETFFLELNPKKFADFRSAEAQHEVDKNPDSIENLDAKMKF